MDIFVLDQNFNTVYILDRYESILWIDRFYEHGEFEIYTPVTKDILKYLVKDNYLFSRDSEHMMIIEDFTIDSDTETGDHVKIIGRSLESILDRRIVWNQTTFKDGTNLQNGIKKLLNDAIISPSIADRKIANFVFQESTDTSITSLTMDNQYTGDNLLEVIETLCETNKIGFKIILDDQNQFVFSLYNGVDRSYNQNSLPYVTFRPTYDNIINSNYREENSKAKNVTLVAGSGEGSARKTRIVGSGIGLLRRELFTDARDLQKEDGMSDATYNKLLDKRGKEKLEEANSEIKTFDGKCDTTQMFIYGRNFYMGDIVQVSNEYGMESSARITEFTWNYSNNGFETYPTFTAINEEEEGS